jgi:hypothetical protein
MTFSILSIMSIFQWRSQIISLILKVSALLTVNHQDTITTTILTILNKDKACIKGLNRIPIVNKHQHSLQSVSFIQDSRLERNRKTSNHYQKINNDIKFKNGEKR